jgi:hypothetical protein
MKKDRQSDASEGSGYQVSCRVTHWRTLAEAVMGGDRRMRLNPFFTSLARRDAILV